MARAISERTTAEMIGLLCTVNVKIFHIHDEIADPQTSVQRRSDLALELLKLNERRCDLTREIDIRLGDGGMTVLVKRYGKKS